MFKTKEQIEEMVKEHFVNEVATLGEGNPPELVVKWILEGFKAGHARSQKDLLESAGEGFEEYSVDRFILDKNEYARVFDAHTGNYLNTKHLKELWQACALFHKAKIDTLKQRELEYQIDLRQKDAEIDRLKKKIISFDAYASADEKYQEAVKDIQKLLDIRDRLRSKLVSMRAFEIVDSVFNPIRIKYGLYKEEK